MAKNALHPTTIKFDTETKARVDRLAEAIHRSPHWLVLEAVKQYVVREEKRQAFRQGAIDAWNEYKETGLHVTGDEVIAWVETWGEENENAAPICHE